VNRNVTVLDDDVPPLVIDLPRPSMTLVMAVSGRGSTVQAYRAGVASVLPDVSTARTSIV
jgi:hypothetical protein